MGKKKKKAKKFKFEYAEVRSWFGKFHCRSCGGPHSVSSSKNEDLCTPCLDKLTGSMRKMMSETRKDFALTSRRPEIAKVKPIQL